MKWKEEEDYEQNKTEIEWKIKERKEFLAEHKKNLWKSFKNVKNEREQLKQAEADYYSWKLELHAKLSKQMLDYFEKNKEKIYHEPKETKKVAKFLKKPDVKEVFDKYDKELWHFF